MRQHRQDLPIAGKAHEAPLSFAEEAVIVPTASPESVARLIERNTRHQPDELFHTQLGSRDCDQLASWFPDSEFSHARISIKIRNAGHSVAPCVGVEARQEDPLLSAQTLAKELSQIDFSGNRGVGGDQRRLNDLGEPPKMPADTATACLLNRLRNRAA